MKYGWVRITACFTKEQATEWTKDMWKRLGYDPNNKSTWYLERINMPALNWDLEVAQFAPKAWGAITDICGGEDRISDICRNWGDGFIVNFGKEKLLGRCVDPRGLDNWHVAGDCFVHYLDSPEQALLVIPCITDVLENGGATYICPDGIEVVAKHLHDNPDGVTPYMLPRGSPQPAHQMSWFGDQVKDPSKCNLFQQMTGKCGDVVLMHPFMMHSASRNSLHIPCVITNPLVSVKEPFNFNRENPDDFSLIEMKTMAALGKKRLPDWKATGPRETIKAKREES